MRHVVAVGVIFCGSWALSCSASGETGGESSGAAASGGSGGSGGALVGAGGGIGVGGSGPDCNLTCSKSLLEVVCEETGEVVEVCTDGQGCGNGSCVPACEAAAINNSTVGCDYYAINPDVTFSAGACYAAFVANTWNTPVELEVEWDGAALDASTFTRIPSGNGNGITYTPLPDGKLPPGEVAVVFLAQFGAEALYKPVCPPGITPAVTSEDAALHGTGIGRSFHIRASVPVSAYDIFPYGGGKSAITSATLLVPTTAWGTNYIAVAPYQTTEAAETFHSWIQLVADEDDTEITISPTAAIVGGPSVPSTGAGQPATYTIDRGDVLQITQLQELSGSPIQSTKPVGLVGGNRCMVIPAGSSACDAGHQMLTPVQAMGNRYVGVPHRDRTGTPENPPWRIVGAVNGTTLSYEPSAPPGAPTTIDTGEVVEFNSGTPFVVESQDADHPFYMSGHMTGCATVSPSTDCRGDPESVNVVPTSQYLTEYVFFTDPTYSETHLVLVRERGPNGFADVELDCAGTIGGWQPLGSSGQFEYAYVDLVTGNFQPVGNCDNGRREARSDGPFTITVWGWGSAATGGDPFGGSGPGYYTQYVSYAYPAGAGVSSVTEIEVPPAPASATIPDP